MRNCSRSVSARFPRAALIGALLTSLSVCPAGCRREAGRPSAEEPLARVISVCELLEDVALYRGKIVVVRGIDYYGLRAPSCAGEFITGGRRWPWAVAMVHSTYPSGAGEEAPPFTTEQESWRAWNDLVRHQAERGLRGEIWMTVVGMVRAPKEYVRADGAVFAGYGHLGAFPAELVVKRIFDIEVKRDPPTYDYSIILKYPAL